jgi:hypothetical protein
MPEKSTGAKKDCLIAAEISPVNDSLTFIPEGSSSAAAALP